MKKITHCDVESVGGIDPLARTIWACAFIQTDGKGAELRRDAVLISEALPFLAGDTFWSKRKNEMLCKVLCDYRTVTAREFWDLSADYFSDSAEFWAFNSRFEIGAFKNFARSFNLPEITMPPVYDLALWAFDAFPFSQYAAYALEHKLYSESGKSFSSKCEHLLSWLISSGRMAKEAEHDHLALSDTISQLSMYKALLQTKKRKPKAGATLTHFEHPTWRKWLKLDPSAKGRRYVKV